LIIEKQKENLKMYEADLKKIDDKIALLKAKKDESRE